MIREILKESGKLMNFLNSYIRVNGMVCCLYMNFMKHNYLYPLYSLMNATKITPIF